MAASAVRRPEMYIDVDQQHSQSRAGVEEEDDEWAGLADKAERRKRQNRLHQRAWRRRKALEASEAALVASDQGNPSSGFWVLKPIAQGRQQQQQVQLYRPAGSKDRSRGAAYGGFVLATSASSPSPSSFSSSSRAKVIPPLLHYVDTDQAGGDGHRKGSSRYASVLCNLPLFVLPDGFLLFPLAPDHRLITLIQYNVLRATLTNMAILAILHTVDAECGLDQLVGQMRPPLPQPPGTAADLPASLWPTALQRATPDHAIWIDSVPSAPMRDNLIRTFGAWDPDDLCCDLLGGLYEGFDDVERRGMIVWSDPWLPDGWEVTEGFARKWTFLLRGCEDLLAATNRWRAQRGEEPLVVDLGV